MHEKQPDNPQHQNEPAHEVHPTQEREQQPKPAIYVASLADYNSGVLHGAWIDAARDPEDIQADINAMLARSREPNAEEWAIHDYDQFGRWRVSEYDSVAQVSRIAKGIAEHGYAYAAWADVFDGEPASFDIDSFQEAYLGHYESTADYVDQMADDLGYTQELDKLPESLQPYVRFDTNALARDMELSGDIATVPDPVGGVWIFRADL